MECLFPILPEPPPLSENNPCGNAHFPFILRSGFFSRLSRPGFLRYVRGCFFNSLEPVCYGLSKRLFLGGSHTIFSPYNRHSKEAGCGSLLGHYQKGKLFYTCFCFTERES
jgi:hypothetical protein